MYPITCRQCGTVNMVSDRQVESRHQTSEGVVLYARCASGHRMMHLSEPSYPFPPPPPSVRALQDNDVDITEDHDPAQAADAP